MSTNTDPSSGYAVTPAARDEALRNIVMITYILYVVGFFVGITMLVGLIVAYVKRGDAAGTIYESHFTWLIRTFWIGLLLSVIGLITSFILIGIPILIATGIWSIYRVVKGFLAFNDRKPIAAPAAFF
ncbi:hypothetical protein GCM10007301_01660 [Azorhizobium oxalatiphilum]|uniref:Transmembrane protein n=1 Tax=Azorhizobium oxalatiphilum TaxID=980631 RepID=A0A917BJT0_9HYPH|nr:hypothetical protein [Azorhizobium oxalatiphilum]GGF45840.1 hypothetical protein GCM10007301_01660 [Azorhizobium oxalatiphilum]